MSFGVPSVSWGSNGSSSLACNGLPFIATDDDPCSLTESLLSLPYDTFASSPGYVPPIDEAIFDFVGYEDIPDLEDVGDTGVTDNASSFSFMSEPADLSLVEIPALEEVVDFQSPASSPVTSGGNQEIPVTVTQPDIFADIVLEDVLRDEVDLPGAVIQEGLLTLPPFGAGEAPLEKRRRISQISNASSSCSSTGDSLWSPISSVTTDSDVEQKSRGGRKPRFSPEDRRERKKAQNRTAAERYRLKRRMIEETVDDEEQKLIEANGLLKTEVTKLEAEVSCLKRLMREMLEAKGIVISKK